MALHRRTDINEPRVVVEAAPLLRVCGPSGECLDHPLRAIPMVLGRSGTCDIQLDHEQVSRRHAEITADPHGKLHLMDLGSRNGVLLHGRAVCAPIPLEPGTAVEIGPFRVELLPPPQADQPAVMNRSIVPVDDSAYSTLVEIDPKRTTFDPQVLSHLHELDDQLVRLTSVHDRYQRICDFEIHENRGALYCAVLDPHTVNGQDEVVVLRQSSRYSGDRPPYISRTLVNRVAVSRQPVMLSNITDEGDGVMLSLSPEKQEIAAIACPLEESRGMLLYATYNPNAVTGRWLDLLVLIADQFRHAEAMLRVVEQTQARAMIDRDLGRARDIQLGLLPGSWSNPALDIAIGFEPCKWVGGDYADILTIPDGRVVAAIADVSGKGLPAALISSSIHTMIHAVLDAGGSPALAMTQLNRYLIEFAPLGAFATMLLLAIDTQTGESEVFNAGHLPVVRLPAQGEAELIGHGQYLPLGIDLETYEPQHIRLDPGDAWLLYSDGLSEMTTASGRMLGIEGVRDVATKLNEPDAAQTVKRLLSWLAESTADSEQADDQTLMVVRRRI